MLKSLDKVLNRENEVINKVVTYQQFCHREHTDSEYSQRAIAIDNYFNTFTDNEIMILQSIMYMGRDEMSGGIPFTVKDIDTTLKSYLHELSFKIDEKIDKEIEIHQMTEKGLRIGDYFKTGFHKIHELRDI